MEIKILRGRYKITQLLGRGGFGETYLAEDGDRPGNPICVVKQLQVNSNSPSILKAAQRLFNNEAEILYKLGSHAQIPQLLAHFEENNQFFLVQEFIDGHDLSEEINPDRRWNEKQIVAFLIDVLTILKFVHGENVIHRDIKPSNLIRRKQDGKIFLIDFGVVKEIQLPNTTQINSYATISVGTPGYVPNEQLGGKPRFSSDIYALGITAIQALTKLYPGQIAENTQTGEIIWRPQAQVGDRLANILDKMVKSHFRDRYQFVEEVLADLQNISIDSLATFVSNTTKNQWTAAHVFVAGSSQQPTTNNRSVGLPQSKPIRLPIIIALIATTAIATFYVSRSLLPTQPVATPVQTPPSTALQPVAKPTQQANPPKPIIRRSPVAKPTQQANPPKPEVSSRPVSPTLPATSILPEISSPIINTKISPPIEPPTPATEPIPLTEVQCSTTSANSNRQSFVESLEDLTIGEATVTAIAELASQNHRNPSNSQIKADTPAGVDCLLNPRDSDNQFNTLKLAFGINDTNKYLSNLSNGTKVRLTVYLDRKNIGSKEVTKGEIKTWGLDIADVQNVALEAECIKSSNIPKICPALVFTQLDLN
ncbi:MAG: protein kinase [Chroococcus sp. CMT-3BRIN-NPC107]|jgi:serine/threonine-protein kinase|nr:protein kinase [Chroococcus sp. CMT-3BRIN-NPC107]